MKQSDIKIGDIVYFKKSSSIIVDKEKPFKVLDIEKRKRKHHRIILDGFKINAGELTDIPCSKMECNNCKYHNKI